ncbi:MAG TPA: Asp-tRNA(Asn)/Glu-tRNA(Gln) amidotransferase subunit GatC [Terriglobales bacterium]|jgi:aspartyl-tRNA(Asn)/glutamyl-tRNA(Gln) amidotransferase subunit C|nr:Asp-tRNA(Asn)/Glu-tRNA(Gln) amidotransferase subunit GatC [Terriglobales bacterium]
MKITQNDVQYVAGLANLELTDPERAHLEKDLNAILEYIGRLAEVDTSNVEPMAQVMQIASSGSLAADGLRSDEPRECLPRDAALTNAPQTDGAFFRVPKVIER